MNAIFSYKESKIYIQCNIQDKMLDICRKFSTKICQDVDSKIYIYMGKVLNLDSTLAQQLNVSLENSSGIREILIIVYDNDKDSVLIKYNYEGEDRQVQLKKGDNILKRISSLIKQPYEKINILYNGGEASEDDFNKDFNQLANEQNKEDKTMSLLIFDRSNTIDEKESEEKENKEKGKNEEKDKKDEENKKKDKKYVVKEVRKFLQKMYSILVIQYACILFFGLLGFYVGINDAFTQNLGSMLGTFIPITLISLFGGFFASLDDARNCLSKQMLYILLSIFVPITVFYCFLLSKYVQNYYITCGIILFFTDICCSTIYYFIFNKYRGILILLISSIFNIITIVIYCTLVFDEINGSVITILIFMALIMNLYITVYNLWIRQLVTDDEILIAAMVFNYLIFFPVIAFIILAPLIILGLLLLILFGLFLLFQMFFASLFSPKIY